MTRLTDETLVKTNKYQYLSVAEVKDIHVESSEARLQRIGSGDVRSEEDVRRWLGDEEGELRVFRSSKQGRDVLITVATGIHSSWILEDRRSEKRI